MAERVRKCCVQPQPCQIVGNDISLFAPKVTARGRPARKIVGRRPTLPSHIWRRARLRDDGMVASRPFVSQVNDNKCRNDYHGATGSCGQLSAGHVSMQSPLRNETERSAPVRVRDAGAGRPLGTNHTHGKRDEGAFLGRRRRQVTRPAWDGIEAVPSQRAEGWKSGRSGGLENVSALVPD